MGKVLVEIAVDNYARTWGAHGTGSRRNLGVLARSSQIWLSKDGWKVKSSEVQWVLRTESTYTSSLRAVRKNKLRQKWDSARLGVRV